MFSRRSNSLFDKFFNGLLLGNGVFPSFEKWGNPFKFEEYEIGDFKDFEDLEEEKFEVNKGDYRTTIICKFNKQGFMVSHSYLSEYVPSHNENELNELKTKLTSLVEAQDFEKAAEVQKQIRKLEIEEEIGKKKDSKPTS